MGKKSKNRKKNEAAKPILRAARGLPLRVNILGSSLVSGLFTHENSCNTRDSSFYRGGN